MTSTLLRLVVWLSFGLVVVASPLQDLQRAKTKVPRNEYRGSGFSDMGAVLTKHLRSNYHQVVTDCSKFSLLSLRQLQMQMFSLSAAELVRLYAGTADSRQERHSSVDALQTHWQGLTSRAPMELMPVLRDGLCHEVVMRFVHHLNESTRAMLLQDPAFSLPTVPMLKHENNGHMRSSEVFREYASATGCQACHSRLVPLPSPAVPQDCIGQLVKQCGKRGQLGKESCLACAAKDVDETKACSPKETAAWCDHPDACIGADKCPVWPTEFAAPFTLHATIPYINGAKCNFYYKYTEEVQVQTVDYYEKCFPFVNIRTQSNNLPCKLIFNPKGIYLSQPGRVDCCKFVDGVGAAPPEFLQSFKLTGRDVDAPDMYGNSVKCDKWEGPGGFKYWTVGDHDKVYSNFGHDIVFQDGPTGITWRWGNFTVAPQSDALFQLPSGNCEQSCPKFLSTLEIEQLQQDSHVRRASMHHQLTGVGIITV